VGAAQEFVVQVVETRTEADAARDLVVEEDRGAVSERRADLRVDANVARVAHQVERGDVLQRVCEPA